MFSHVFRRNAEFIDINNLIALFVVRLRKPTTFPNKAIAEATPVKQQAGFPNPFWNKPQTVFREAALCVCYRKTPTVVTRLFYRTLISM